MLGLTTEKDAQAREQHEYERGYGNGKMEANVDNASKERNLINEIGRFMSIPSWTSITRINGTVNSWRVEYRRCTPVYAPTLKEALDIMAEKYPEFAEAINE